MKCCVVGAGNSNGKVGASRAMGDAGTDGRAVLIENQRRIVGARSSGRRVGRQHLCCGSRSGRPGYASRAGRSGRPGYASRASRAGRGDDKRKVAINPQTMGNYKKIKSITLRMEPSGTTWAAFLRGQAGKEEIY